MKVSPHFLRLYNQTARRYKKLNTRLKSQVSTGKFQQNSAYFQKQFVFQIEKLRKRLFDLRFKLKLAVAAGTIIFFSSTNELKAQTTIGPFNRQPRNLNPLREPLHFAVEPAPAPVDLDDDGDLDIVVGDSSTIDNLGSLRYFKNVGTVNKPILIDDQENNPFAGISFGKSPSPSFGDFDKDGDMDMVVGFRYGVVSYYKNIGDPRNPKFEFQEGSWNENDKTGNPFSPFSLSQRTAPHFVDLDKDGHLDALIGTNTGSYYTGFKRLIYLKNQGNGNLIETALSGISISVPGTSPTTLDFDNDGDYDILIGKYNGVFKYFKNNGNNNFSEPFNTDNPLYQFYLPKYPAPAALDFDKDGDYDLVVGYDLNNYKDGGLVYLENKEGVFVRKSGLDDPFSGVTVDQNASPFFVDTDSDGDLDVVVGGQNFLYGTRVDPGASLRLYKNNLSTFLETTIAQNPFGNLAIQSNFVPSLIDLDGDNDLDLVGAAQSNIQYFLNVNGTYVEQDFSTGPFQGIISPNGKTDFVDIDGDGDFDMLIGRYNNGLGYVDYYKNTGTPSAPLFAQQSGSWDPVLKTGNPLNFVNEEYQLFPRFVDIDHDGDFDALIGEGGNQNSTNGNEFLFYQNVGSATNPVFVEVTGGLMPQGSNPLNPAPIFNDFDNDGDLDLFLGNNEFGSGEVASFKNNNPAPVTTLNTSPITVTGTTGSIIFDPTLTITDTDNDSISYAVVKISGFRAGDGTLTFTMPTAQPAPAIFENEALTLPYNGVADNGVLVFKGKGTAAFYQALLRSITFNYTAQASSGRKKNSSGRITTKSVTIRVVDVELTNTSDRVRSFSIGVNEAPVFVNNTVNVVAGKSVTVDLDALISDPDNNEILTSIILNPDPSRKGIATLSGTNLTIDYAGLSFVGSENLTLRVSDAGSLFDDATITVNVTNSAPLFANQAATAKAGEKITVDLNPLISDADNNLVMSTLILSQSPASGAIASINASGILTVDYAGLNFTGSETVKAKVCDVAGICAESSISITITNTPPVITTATSTIAFAGKTIINLLPLISDADNNIDLTSLKVVQQPSSKAIASIDANNNLIVDYKGLSFAGSEDISIEVCDLAATCALSVITITVNNTAPVITPVPVVASQGMSLDIDLTTITTDSDNNLNLQSFQIVEQPKSGAKAQITNGILKLDYAGISFKGIDLLRIRVCDVAGACTENNISIEIDVSANIEIFNAIAPNGSSIDNRYFRIENIPPNNKVSIFNRWGDMVYEKSDYNNDTPGKRFEGLNDNGNPLTSGVYFYKIEFADGTKTLTGYLSLKQ